MNALNIIKNEIAHELGYSDWNQMHRVDPESCLEKINEVAIRYSKCSWTKLQYIGKSTTPNTQPFETKFVLTYGYDNEYVASFIDGEFYSKHENDQDGNPKCISLHITHWCEIPELII